MQDPEFEGKMIFNKKTMHARRQQYKSLVNFCNFDANQSKNIQPSTIGKAWWNKTTFCFKFNLWFILSFFGILPKGELCKRTIYYKYHNFTGRRKVDILVAKGFKNHAELRTKALLDFPSSDFSKSFLTFMDKRRFDFEEAAPVKPKIDAQLLKSVKKYAWKQTKEHYLTFLKWIVA